jgi:hypothetical protein
VTLNADRMRANYTEEELQEFEKNFMKAILSELEPYTNLPLCLVCMDPNNAW